MIEPMQRPDVDLHFARDVRRDGGSERRLHRGVSSGELSKVRRGSFLSSDIWGRLSIETQHMVRVVATAEAARTTPTVSHESAAVFWRAPIVEGLPTRVQITVRPGSGLRSNGSVERHEAPLTPLDVIDVDQFRLTSVERTLIDFSARRSLLSGVCAVEGLLQRGLTTPDMLSAAMARRGPFRGSRRVRAVLDFAGTLSQSPNESLCRVRFRQLGYAQPEQQRSFVGTSGQHYDVDFYWPQYDVICETDGRAKYEDPAYLNGRSPQQALWDEKRREDELRAQCRGFVRLTWADAWDRAGLVSKLTRAGIPRRR